MDHHAGQVLFVELFGLVLGGDPRFVDARGVDFDYYVFGFFVPGAVVQDDRAETLILQHYQLF